MIAPLHRIIILSEALYNIQLVRDLPLFHSCRLTPSKINSTGDLAVVITRYIVQKLTLGVAYMQAPNWKYQWDIYIRLLKVQNHLYLAKVALDMLYFNHLDDCGTCQKERNIRSHCNLAVIYESSNYVYGLSTTNVKKKSIKGQLDSKHPVLKGHLPLPFMSTVGPVFSCTCHIKLKIFESCEF